MFDSILWYYQNSSYHEKSVKNNIILEITQK